MNNMPKELASALSRRGYISTLDMLTSLSRLDTPSYQYSQGNRGMRYNHQASRLALPQWGQYNPRSGLYQGGYSRRKQVNYGPQKVSAPWRCDPLKDMGYKPVELNQNNDILALPASKRPASDRQTKLTEFFSEDTEAENKDVSELEDQRLENKEVSKPDKRDFTFELDQTEVEIDMEDSESPRSEKGIDIEKVMEFAKAQITDAEWEEIKESVEKQIEANQQAEEKVCLEDIIRDSEVRTGSIDDILQDDAESKKLSWSQPNRSFGLSRHGSYPANFPHKINDSEVK